MALGVSACAISHKTITQADNHGLDIYLLIGQSNMAGRAEIAPAEKDTLSDVFLFTGKGWEPAANPLNKYSTVRKALSFQQLGPGYSFARTLAKCSGRKIGLVVNARGGSTLQSWEKGYKGADDVDLYEKTVVRIKMAEKQGKLKGIIWHQGENNYAEADLYMGLLKTFIKDLRHDLGHPVFFVAGELGKWHEIATDMNRVIDRVPAEISHADFLVTDELSPLHADTANPHFDTQSQLILGRRYAAKVLKVVYGLTPCNP